ncbi:alpha methylacyl-CoA racemase [Aspergillus vadensis CBS 113365]|uniref:Alpha methylacyl-CoA racemase n=1 Tax=Aspergillus vadensis (strain CBS 113365 / IMI 142717 / IBT 24658) TaxID=1448311 RepID=A0A319CKN2_ASPVC|nr:alpha methylacyl-CoA racemase [Aspergillus vadensis CBS 113365]PYH68882.1 alpha methylacyl-CoA racemase [Aspergillus vadensis CBS 113365]
MTVAHETIPGTEVYGPGTFIDKTVLPVPVDARRVFELLASRTPGFTQNKAVWDTVHFEGRPEPMVQGPIKSPVMAAALHAMGGVVANELLELRDGKPATENSVTVNTDHAGIWLGSVFTTYINGSDDPKVWYQLHGSLDANAALRTMGINPDVTFSTPQQYYDYIQGHIIKWSPDELEMHNVRHGLCGSICYSPEGWRKTEFGKRLSRHPLVNVTAETYAKPTPPIPLVKGLSDKRPLAGIKVLEMVRIIAGPQIGVTLASYGADVIRVNCSRLVDLNVLQLTLNAGKRTIDLDITKPKDMERLQELLADVDIFIQGFRMGSLERKGLGLRNMLEIAAKRNKGIIYVDENCYGPDGPFHERPGWQQIGDAASGSEYVMGRSQGYEEGKSVLPPLPVSDMITGIVGAVGALIAVKRRAVEGGSYHITSSLVAADAVALEKEVGLYPLEVVRDTVERFGFKEITPDQYVSEVLIPVIDGWKRGLPHDLDEDSRFMTTFKEPGPWGRQTLLKPVAKLGLEEATPRLTSPPVPHCHHGRYISWL